MTAPEVMRYNIDSVLGVPMPSDTGRFMLYADHAAAVAEYKADAERYRWLRNHGLVASDPQKAEELDAAIDAARGSHD